MPTDQFTHLVLIVNTALHSFLEFWPDQPPNLPTVHWKPFFKTRRMLCAGAGREVRGDYKGQGPPTHQEALQDVWLWRKSQVSRTLPWKLLFRIMVSLQLLLSVCVMCLCLPSALLCLISSFPAPCPPIPSTWQSSLASRCTCQLRPW